MAHKVLSGTSDNQGVLFDARVNAARMLTELLMFYISRHDMYCSNTSTISSNSAEFPMDITKPFDNLLTTKVLPLLQRMMLSGSDPMPLYAQKVLAALLPRCCSYCQAASCMLENTCVHSANVNCREVWRCAELQTTRSVLLHVCSIPSVVKQSER